MFLCRWRRDYREAIGWYAQRINAEKTNGRLIVHVGNKRCSKKILK
jgi:hypothetical protein